MSADASRPVDRTFADGGPTRSATQYLIDVAGGRPLVGQSGYDGTCSNSLLARSNPLPSDTESVVAGEATPPSFRTPLPAGRPS
jgi:hypothetical protein